MTILHFILSIDGLEDDSLVVRGFEGQEALSDSYFQNTACFGFRYHINLASRKEKLKPDQVVDRNAELRIYRNGDCVQRVHGIVRQFTQGDIGYHYAYYSLILVPALERLSLRHNSRIFQQQTTIDIVTTLLQEMGIEEFAFALRGKCQPREFCVQYRETDLEFLHRLAAEEGWVYGFEHLEGKHTLLFSDHSTVLPTLDDPIVHNNLSGGIVEEPYISSFSKLTQTEVSEVKLKDYSFKKPAYDFLHNPYASDIGYQRDSYEHYDYPGRYKDNTSGKTFSQVRLEYLRRVAHLATGQSNQPLIRAGYRFEMVGHVNQEMNRKWMVVSVTHKGTQPQALEEEGHQGATTYSNTFHVIPSSKTWRATPQPKPQIDGSMIAIVAGPPEEEIFCDEYGRVKVHFPWDRYSEQNEHSSCWVRVSQGWAGDQYGMMAIPRIGHEVIVSFLNGDPDQPIITGRTYHAKNPPPYILPTNKTKTTLKTQTHKGAGFNELSFDDQNDNQLIYVHAQKDYREEVRHDQSKNVGNDREKHIGNDQRLTVGQDEQNTINRDRKTTIGQDQFFEVGRDEHRLIKRHLRLEVQDQRHEFSRANHDLHVDGHYTQKVQGKSTLESSQGVLVHTDTLTLNGSKKVVIQGPGGKIVIDSGGVTIEAPGIKLKGPVAVSTGAKAQLATLEGAANEGTPLVDLCSDCGE